MSTKLTEQQTSGLRDLARARGPADRTAVPLRTRHALFRRGLVNGAWRVTPAGELLVSRALARQARASRSGGAR